MNNFKIGDLVIVTDFDNLNWFDKLPGCDMWQIVDLVNLSDYTVANLSNIITGKEISTQLSEDKVKHYPLHRLTLEVAIDDVADMVKLIREEDVQGILKLSKRWHWRRFYDSCDIPDDMELVSIEYQPKGFITIGQMNKIVVDRTLKHRKKNEQYIFVKKHIKKERDEDSNLKSITWGLDKITLVTKLDKIYIAEWDVNSGTYVHTWDKVE